MFVHMAGTDLNGWIDFLGAVDGNKIPSRAIDCT